jgi:thiol-disulfide isomerase/thioredoxin
MRWRTELRWRWAVASIGLCLISAESLASAPDITGRWDATVVVNTLEVPFRFEIAQNGRDVVGYFFEGSRKVASTSGRFENAALTLEYDFLNTVLEARVEGDELRGTYRNKRPNARPIEFRARRFAPMEAATRGAPQVGGEWVMYRTAQDASKLDVSWRLHLKQADDEVSGAILKTSGDGGTLVGRWHDGRLTMSHFAGDRPLVFEAEFNPDGTLSITLDQKFTYRAARNARLGVAGIPEPPDLSRFTGVKNRSEPFHFSGSDLDGKMTSDADARFRGRVVVVTIGGTWCPNCRDEAPFLKELYNEFHPRGLEVVGLFFENDADPSVVRPRVLSFAARYEVPFPILVSGTTDQAPAKLAQLVNFSVFPTTIVLGRDGRVRSVHAGFASIATGEAHARLTREQRALVERLLEERVQDVR